MHYSIYRVYVNPRTDVFSCTFMWDSKCFILSLFFSLWLFYFLDRLHTVQKYFSKQRERRIESNNYQFIWNTLRVHPRVKRSVLRRDREKERRRGNRRESSCRRVKWMKWFGEKIINIIVGVIYKLTYVKTRRWQTYMRRRGAGDNWHREATPRRTAWSSAVAPCARGNAVFPPVRSPRVLKKNKKNKNTSTRWSRAKIRIHEIYVRGRRTRI